jgi:hypothetical protein
MTTFVLVSSPNFCLARLVEMNSCFAYLACTRRTEEGMIQGFLDVSYYFFQHFIELLKRGISSFQKNPAMVFMSPRMNEWFWLLAFLDSFSS